MKYLVALILLISTCIFVPSASAQQGCCSWHDGVCGNTCCDGTPLSAKCGGGYDYDYEPTYYYTAPAIPEFPQINATWDLQPDLSNGFTITVKLDDPNPSQYSVTLNKYKGGDPGPKVDYTTPNFQFINVKQGKWYMNVKKDINGTWSRVAYYTVDVPAWYKPTPIPTPIAYVKDYNTTNTESSGGNGWLWLVGIIIAGAGVLKIKEWIMKLFN